MQYEAYCGIRKAREDMIRLNLVGAKSLKGLGASGKLGLEGLCYSCIPTLFSNGSFYCLENSGEVFCRVLRFLLR